MRQSDPFSPFLFVLAREVLARLIEREALYNGIKGFKLVRDLTPITHLQFANDLFIFAQVNEENLDRIKYCLDVFSSWSGQKIIFFKSFIIYSRNTPYYLKSRLANSIGINASNKKEKYLSIPIASGKDKKGATKEIIKKVKQRLQVGMTTGRVWAGFSHTWT